MTKTLCSQWIYAYLKSERSLPSDFKAACEILDLDPFATSFPYWKVIVSSNGQQSLWFDQAASDLVEQQLIPTLQWVAGTERAVLRLRPLSRKPTTEEAKRIEELRLALGMAEHQLPHPELTGLAQYTTRHVEAQCHRIACRNALGDYLTTLRSQGVAI